jgi:hypothetical protein
MAIGLFSMNFLMTTSGSLAQYFKIVAGLSPVLATIVVRNYFLLQIHAFVIVCNNDIIIVMGLGRGWRVTISERTEGNRCSYKTCCNALSFQIGRRLAMLSQVKCAEEYHA